MRKSRTALLLQSISCLLMGGYYGIAGIPGQSNDYVAVPVGLAFMLMAVIGLCANGSIKETESRLDDLEKRLHFITAKTKVIEHLSEFENLNR